jgi:hypothetical protein
MRRSEVSRWRVATASLTEVREELIRYASDHSIWIELGGLYDLFPRRRTKHDKVEFTWPARWPNGNYQGIYLFFDRRLPEPSLLYVGKSLGKSSCIRTRLNGYFDASAKRSTNKCVLLQEWNGYQRPWGTGPRYVVTVAMEPDCESGKCRGAEILEEHMIVKFLPPENRSLKPSD